MPDANTVIPTTRSRFANRTGPSIGGDRGIGAALAEGFTREGGCVAVTDIDFALANATVIRITAEGGTGLALRLDVTDTTACLVIAAQVATAFGPTSILIDHAGILIPDAFDTGTASDAFRRTFDVNLHCSCARQLPATSPEPFCLWMGVFWPCDRWCGSANAHRLFAIPTGLAQPIGPVVLSWRGIGCGDLVSRGNALHVH